MFLHEYLSDMIKARDILKLGDYDFNLDMLKYNKQIKESKITDEDYINIKNYYNEFKDKIISLKEKITSKILNKIIKEKYNIDIKIPYLTVKTGKEDNCEMLAENIKNTAMEHFIILDKQITDKQKNDVVIIDSFIKNYFDLRKSSLHENVFTFIKEVVDEILEDINDPNKDNSIKENKIFNKPTVKQRFAQSLKELF